MTGFLEQDFVPLIFTSENYLNIFLECSFLPQKEVANYIIAKIPSYTRVEATSLS